MTWQVRVHASPEAVNALLGRAPDHTRSMILVSYLVVTEKTDSTKVASYQVTDPYADKINHLISAFLFCYYFVDYLLRIHVWNYYQKLFQSNE